MQLVKVLKEKPLQFTGAFTFYLFGISVINLFFSFIMRKQNNH